MVSLVAVALKVSVVSLACLVLPDEVALEVQWVLRVLLVLLAVKDLKVNLESESRVIEVTKAQWVNLELLDHEVHKECLDQEVPKVLQVFLGLWVLKVTKVLWVNPADLE